jgi:hydrogenase maturation protease
MPRILILGFGNPDREDDGVAWHILQALSSHFDSPISILDRVEFEKGRHPHLVFSLQLMPEMSEEIARYDFVCFVDAHTGAYPQDVRLAPLKPGFQASPFTHHLTPESCLSLAETLYGHTPKGITVSVRGYCFGYGTALSEKTAVLAKEAVARIVDWIGQPDLCFRDT